VFAACRRFTITSSSPAGRRPKVIVRFWDQLDPLRRLLSLFRPAAAINGPGQTRPLRAGSGVRLGPPPARAARLLLRTADSGALQVDDTAVERGDLWANRKWCPELAPGIDLVGRLAGRVAARQAHPRSGSPPAGRRSCPEVELRVSLPQRTLIAIKSPQQRNSPRHPWPAHAARGRDPLSRSAATSARPLADRWNDRSRPSGSLVRLDRAQIEGSYPGSPRLPPSLNLAG